MSVTYSLSTLSTGFPANTLVVKSDSLTFLDAGDKELLSILTVDLLGVKVFLNKDEESSSAVVIEFLYFPYVGRASGKRVLRSRRVGLPLSSLLSKALEIRRVCLWLAWTNCDVDKLLAGQKEDQSSDGPNHKVPPKRRLLFMLNPVGGQGKAVKLFHSSIEPVLCSSHVSYNCIITEHQNHCREFVRTLDLSTADAIVVVSGDGMVYEVLNGLGERPDRDVALGTVIGIIPTGSGNALFASIMHQHGKKMTMGNALHNVLKGQAQDLRLSVVKIADTADVISFLSVSWGLLADIDIESEVLRFIGGQRFTVYALLRALRCRTYKGVISYLRYLPELSEAEQESTWETVEGDFIMIVTTLLSHFGETIVMDPDLRMNSPYMRLFIIRPGIGFSQLVRTLLSLEDGTLRRHEFVETVQVRGIRIAPDHTQNGNIVVDGELQKYASIEQVLLPQVARVLAVR